MAPQQVESQVFPFQLEWIGGRSTFSQGPFSARNAYICLEDMKESEVVIPVIIEKTQSRVAFRPGNKMMDKVFDLNDIVQIHCFPTDPNYAIFEINSHDGSARFEVVKTPGNESLKNLQDFVFAHNFVYSSEPVLPEQNRESSPSISDRYEAPEPTQPPTDGDASTNFQTTEGYEEVAVEIVDETISKLANSATRSGDPPSVMEIKAEVSVEEVDGTRETPSTTSVSSDTHIHSRGPEAISAELIRETKEVAIDEDSLENENSVQQQSPQQQQQRHAEAEVPKQRKFAKIITLTEIIAEENIDTRNYHDDGKYYIISRKGPKPSNTKSFRSQSNGYSENKSPKGSSGNYQPVAEVYSVTNERTFYRHWEPMKDYKRRNTSASLQIRLETPNEGSDTEVDDSEFVVLARGIKHGHKLNDGLYYFSRNSRALQHNSFKEHPYNESYYSFVYLKNDKDDLLYSDSLNF